MAAWTLMTRLVPACPDFLPGGQPYLPGDERYISVSHSKNLVAVAVSDAPIGIDVERIAARPVATLAKKCMTATEYERFLSAADQTLCFYRHWTAKEAYAKLTGSGLHGYPVNVEWHADGTVGKRHVPALHQTVTDCLGEQYCICVAGEAACVAARFGEVL